MNSKIILPETVCHDEIVDYLAARYCITQEEVIVRFMPQEGRVKSQSMEGEMKVFLRKMKWQYFVIWVSCLLVWNLWR